MLVDRNFIQSHLNIMFRKTWSLPLTLMGKIFTHYYENLVENKKGYLKNNPEPY